MAITNKQSGTNVYEVGEVQWSISSVILGARLSFLGI